jgi:hypothetical protein
VFTRYVLIALALGVGVYRAMQGAWLMAAGLLALAGGLIILKVAERQPALRRTAYLCFAVTVVSLAIILFQRRL